MHADFFRFDWPGLLDNLEKPILVLGNPPWVTNAELGARNADNLPDKANLTDLKGLDALTGRSNFDISEWMVRHLLECLAGRDAAFAVLIKLAVARKLLAHAWKMQMALRDPAIHVIDAQKHFGAAVDACLFTGRTDRVGRQTCPVFDSLHSSRPRARIGFEGGELIADARARAATRHLEATPNNRPMWRSGIKHDCAKVFELRGKDDVLVNGSGEPVDVEPEYLFPLLKSSDVAAGRTQANRWMIVTQRSVGEATEPLQSRAPRLWAYLNAHASSLDARKSRIYRGRPRFSIFGVGDYTFFPWKVAISGLYKKLRFVLVGPDGHTNPVVFDDTVYFLGFERAEDARAAHERLQSTLAQTFLRGLIFWDAKRPITATVLRRLSLECLCATGFIQSPGVREETTGN